MMYARIKQPNDWIPPERHKRSQNTLLLTPVDGEIDLVDALIWNFLSQVKVNSYAARLDS
jgi:hypothetical protein